MSTATAVKIETGEPETAVSDDGPAVAVERSEAGQLAWRGLLRAHACLAKRLDAALDQAHGLPISSYEVLTTWRTQAAGACACATWPSRPSSPAAA